MPHIGYKHYATHQYPQQCLSHGTEAIKLQPNCACGTSATVNIIDLWQQEIWKEHC